MRSIFLVLISVALLFSCSNSSTEKQADDSDSAQSADDQKSGVRTVADAVNDLRIILESGNKTEIAALFPWPLADSVMPVYLDDSVFKKNYTAAGDKLTQNMFIRYYDTISKFTNLADIIEGFKYLPVDSLKYKNELNKEFRDNKEPCTRYYNIRIEEEEVTLTYGTNFNNDYKDPKGKTDDEDVSGCEFASIWMFKFDGNKLKFYRYAAAG